MLLILLFTSGNFYGEIPYTAHGAQITPPPYYKLFFGFMLFLGQGRLGKG